MQSASLYDNFRKPVNYVIYDVIICVQDGNCKKMARENFSIRAFYNITKNQHNPIKTVGRDSFLSPKTPKIQVFNGSPNPQGSHSPYILGDTTRPRHTTCPSLIEIGSKTAEKNSAQTNKQTNQQTLRLAATLRWFTAGGAIRIALRQLLQNRKRHHWWRHNLCSRWKLQKMAWENFSIGAFYNITKNQNNPMKTVGRDSFFEPQNP